VRKASVMFFGTINLRGLSAIGFMFYE